jgi:hypothetical protein
LAAQPHTAEGTKSAPDVIVDRHPITQFDIFDMRTDLYHLSAELMAEDSVWFEVVFAFNDLDIRTADTNSLDLQKHIIWLLDMGDVPVFKHKVSNILENIGFHLVHGLLLQ